MNKADGKEIKRVWMVLAILAILFFIAACILVYVIASKDTTGSFYATVQESKKDIVESSVKSDVAKSSPVPFISVGDVSVSGDVTIIIGSDNEVGKSKFSSDLEKLEVKVEPKQKSEPKIKQKSEPAIFVAPCDLRIDVDEPSQTGYLIWKGCGVNVDSFRIEVSETGSFSDLKQFSTMNILADANRAGMSLVAWVKSDGLYIRVVAIRDKKELASKALKIESSNFPLWPSARFRILPSDKKGEIVLDGSLYDATEFRVKRGFSSWDKVEWLPICKLDADEHFFSYPWQLSKGSDSKVISMQFRNKYKMITILGYM